MQIYLHKWFQTGLRSVRGLLGPLGASWGLLEPLGASWSGNSKTSLLPAFSDLQALQTIFPVLQTACSSRQHNQACSRPARQAFLAQAVLLALQTASWRGQTSLPGAPGRPPGAPDSFLARQTNLLGAPESLSDSPPGTLGSGNPNGSASSTDRLPDRLARLSKTTMRRVRLIPPTELTV